MDALGHVNNAVYQRYLEQAAWVWVATESLQSRTSMRLRPIPTEFLTAFAAL